MKKKVLVGDKEVMDSGLVIIPASDNRFSILLEDLTFCFEFLDDPAKKYAIDTEVVGSELRIKLYNYNNLAGQGFTKEFVEIATIKGRPLGLVFMCYTNDNKSRVFQYTFAHMTPPV